MVPAVDIESSNRSLVISLWNEDIHFITSIFDFVIKHKNSLRLNVIKFDNILYLVVDINFISLYVILDIIKICN